MHIKQQLRDKLARIKAIAEAAQAEGREFTDAEAEEVSRLEPQIKSLREQVQRADALTSKIDALAAIPVDDDTDLGAARPDPRGKAGESAWTKSVIRTLGRVSGLGAKALLTAPINTQPMFIAPLPTEPTNLLDLIAREPYSASTVSYLRQTVRTQNAAAVPDNTTKPTSVYTFEEIEDRLRVVAHLSEAFPIRYLADYVGLSGVLDSEMLNGVRAELERLIIAGDSAAVGVDEWDGISNTTGVRQVAFDTDVLITCRTARTTLTSAGVTPTGWAFNPSDLQDIELMRENADGSGAFLINSAAADTIFGAGLPRVASPAVPAGTAYLADWRAVRLLVREDASTIAATQAGDLFDKNQVKLRCEGRFLSEVIVPSAIAAVDLTSA
jgi:HK97 family phage major capsid protein